MRSWVFPILLAVLVAPSAAEALGTLGEVLAGDENWAGASVFADLGLAATMIALAVIALSVRGRSPTALIWLLDRRVLEHSRNRPDWTARADGE